MSKHRTKHPRRPWADPTAPLRLLHGSRPFDEAEQTKLSLLIHLALEALRRGQATAEDFDGLAVVANVCLIRAEHIDKAARKAGRLRNDSLVPHIQRSQEALLTLKARALRTGRLVATGEELAEITALVDVHDQLLALSTSRQMQQAMREVLARVRRKQVYRLEDAT